MTQETQGTLAELILRHLPFLDRSFLTTAFLCNLLNEKAEIVQGALENLQKYGIDIKNVIIPTKKQIENNWGSYLRDMEYVVNHLGETFHGSSAEFGEESVWHAMYLRKEHYVDPSQNLKLKESTVRLMDLVDFILRYVEKHRIGFDKTSVLIKIATKLKCGANDLGCALDCIQCLESDSALSEYLHQVSLQAEELTSKNLAEVNVE